jgi:hypothetical protein
MRFITSLLVAALMLLAHAMPAAAVTFCSPGMISNTYGVSGETIIPEAGYCGIVGVITLTRKGDVKGNVKQSCVGMTTLSKGTGTFKVYENCMGLATIDFDDGTSGKFHFVVTEGGKTLLFLGDQPAIGVTFTGIGKQL